VRVKIPLRAIKNMYLKSSRSFLKNQRKGGKNENQEIILAL
jgi:hypothetical protein